LRDAPSDPRGCARLRRSARTLFIIAAMTATSGRVSRRGLGAALLACGWLCLATPAFAGPSRFYGLQAWNTPSGHEFKRMAAGGAGTFRLTFDWYAVEGKRGHYQWGRYDSVVARASTAGMTILPTILGTPGWASRKAGWPPRSPGGRRAYAAFVRRLVARYGPEGGFARAHPGVPFKAIRRWQVWNEPNIKYYWTNGKPNAGQYASFVKLTRKAVKSHDPHAWVVLAGLPDSKHGEPMARYLAKLYRVRGFRSSVDAIAIHPYASDDKGIVRAIRRARNVMRHYHDSRKQLYLTEFGWANHGPSESPFVKSTNGQATLVRRTYSTLKKKRRSYHLGLIAWFSWRDRHLYKGERSWWAPYTGLFTTRGHAKPAWKEFARAAGGSASTASLDEDEKQPQQASGPPPCTISPPAAPAPVPPTGIQPLPCP
jgi:polysaccharide biosynthesis protein PslG